MPNSLRLSILNKIVETFSGIQAVENPELHEFDKTFSVVELGPLGDADHKKRYSIGVVPLRESYKHSYPFIERRLSIAIEYRVTVNRGDEKPGVMAEHVLTDLERIVMNNTTWGGLAIDTLLDNNELDMAGYDDKSVEGVLFISVLYRHHNNDPRDTNPA